MAFGGFVSGWWVLLSVTAREGAGILDAEVGRSPKFETQEPFRMYLYKIRLILLEHIGSFLCTAN